MSRILIEGFDHYKEGAVVSNETLPSYWDSDSQVSIYGAGYNANVITGVNSASSIDASKTLNSSDLYVGFWEKFGTVFSGYSRSNTTTVMFYSNNNLNFFIKLYCDVDSTGNYASLKIYLKDKNQNLIIPEVIDLTPLSGAYNIQIRATCVDSNNRLVQMKFNGSTILNHSFQSNAFYSYPTYLSTFDKIEIQKTACINVLTDDIVIDDSSWTGATNVKTILPNAAGAYSNWTPQPLSSPNYEAASAGDIPPAEGGSYVTTLNTLNKDSYNLENFPSGYEATEVKCVQVHGQTQTSPGANEYLQFLIRTGGSNYYSSSKKMGYGWKTLYHLWENNPAGGDWTSSQIRDLQAGFRLVSS